MLRLDVIVNDNPFIFLLSIGSDHMSERAYLYVTLTTGVKRPICTIGPGNTKTHCLHRHTEDTWEPPCLVCNVRGFYRYKTRGMIYTAWKGYLIREEETPDVQEAT